MWDWYNQFYCIITSNIYHNQQRRKSQRDRTFSQNMISLSHTMEHPFLRPPYSQVGSEVMVENEHEDHSHSRRNSFTEVSMESPEVHSDNPADCRLSLDDDDEYPCEGACM